MKRGLFNIAAGVSMLLCVLTLADRCTHSWRVNYCELVIVPTESIPLEGRVYTLATYDGAVFIRYTLFNELLSKRQKLSTGFEVHSSPFLQPRARIGDTLLQRIGFDVFASSNQLPTGYGIEAPSWFVALLFLIMPVIWYSHYRRRIPPGHCKSCGYDLRATPDRCPECGTIAAQTGMLS